MGVYALWRFLEAEAVFFNGYWLLVFLYPWFISCHKSYNLFKSLADNCLELL